MPQIKMPDGVVVNFPDDMPSGEIKQYINQSLEKVNMSKGNEFTRGVARGIDTTKSLAVEGGAALTQAVANKLIGEEVFDVEENVKALRDQTDQAFIDNPTKYKTYKDVTKISEIPGFIASAAGESVPQLAIGLGAGGVGAIAAKQGLKTLATRAGKELTEKELAKAFAVGLGVGAAVPSAAQNIPESYINLIEQGKDAPFEAIAVGALKTSLDVIPQVNILNKLLGPAGTDIAGNILVRGLKEAGQAGVTEGITEAAQTSLDLIAEQVVIDPNREFFTRENIDKLIDSGLKGAVGGAFVGAATSPFMRQESAIKDQEPPVDPIESTNDLAKPTKVKAEKPKLDDLFAEEEVAVSGPNLISPKNLTSQSVLPPLYMNQGNLDTFEQDGISTESLKFVEPEEVGSIGQMIEAVPGATSLNSVYGVASPRDENGRFAKRLKTRREAIDAGTRTDTFFMPGDGEIVINSPEEVAAPRKKSKVKSYQLSAYQNPLNRADVDDNSDTPVYFQKQDIPSLRIDNPGKEWLKSKQRQADDNIAKGGKGLNGSTTGYFNKPILLPTSELVKMPGALGEERIRKSSPKYKPVLESIKKNGFNTDGTILVQVNHNGEPFIVEGNHRAQAAFDAGIKAIPVRFEYVNGGELAAGSMSPLAIEELRVDNKLPQYQKQQGSYNDTKVIPAVLAKNLQAIPLTPEAKVKYKSVLSNYKRLLKELLPSGVDADLSAFEAIQDGLTGDSALGATFASSIYMALNPQTTNSNRETFYHELWHLFENLGLIPDYDKYTEGLTAWVQLDPYLSQNATVEQLLATKEGRAEIRANAFGKWAVTVADQDSLMRVPDLIPSALRPVYRAGIRFLRNLRAMLRGQGINKTEDMFTSVYEGSLSLPTPAAEINQTVNNLVYTQAHARLQRMALGLQQDAQAFADTNFDEIVAEARKSANNKTAKDGRISLYTRWVASYQHAASKNAMINEAFQSFRRKNQNYNTLLRKYHELLGDFTSAPKDVRYRIFDLADQNRKNGVKAKLDEEGSLVYEKDGKFVRLKNKDISRQYMQLQAAYSEVLNDHEDQIRYDASKRFKDLLTSDKFSMKELDNAIAAVSEEANPMIYKGLNDLKSALTGIARMRKSDYAPHQRYGSWGITIRDRATGEQVDLFTVEDGSMLENKSLKGGEQLYNKFQMEEVIKRIKENYSDTTKYKIVGGSGEVTDLTKLVPFKLTYNTIKDSIDPRFINVESLSSLLHTKGMDMEAYEKMRADLYSDIMTRGFKTRFAKDDDVGVGYSNDWDRVLHSSFSGAGHFFAGTQHAKELAVIQRETDKLTDEGLKAKINSYVNYSSSPQEDFQSLRTFNFLWTMGGNVSTAALQMFTLPTVTAGVLSQYNPNILQNYGRITKWTGIALKEFIPTINKTIYSNDGLMYVNFNDTKLIESLIKRGVMTEPQAVFLMKAAGDFRGGLVEDFTGLTPFEVRSDFGKAKKTLSRVGYYLGLPISLLEQISRFATTMSAFETFESSDANVLRAKDILANDPRFQSMQNHQTNYDVRENLASFVMEEAHAVFGKHGRSEYLRGVGGAVFVPFATYQHQTLELLTRMYGRGPDGKRALAVTLLSMMLFSGLMGLPGAELLKELFEQIENQLTGSEEDLDLLIREKIYASTGSVTAGKFATQGIGRAFLNLDVSKRLSLGVPGTDLILMATGANAGDATQMFGVAGSIIPSIFDAYNSYMTDSKFSTVLGSVTPVAAGNLVKAYDMSQNGVTTRGGVKLLNPEDITTSTKVMRALGVGSDQVATKREELYYGKILTQRKFKVGVDRLRNKAKNHYSEYLKYDQRENNYKAKEEFNAYKDTLKEYIAFAKKNKIPLDLPAFNRSIFEASRQRLNAKIDRKSIKKHSRQNFDKLQEVLGTSDR